MRNLTQGMHGADVLFLQCLINKAERASTVAEDGQFGPLTRAAVTRFQQREHLPGAGYVGAGTWARLGAVQERLHATTLVAQPTGMTCWRAAAAMALHARMPGAGGAVVDPSGGLDMAITNIETFLSSLGWRMVNNQTMPSLATVIAAVRSAPLWVAYRGDGFAHAVVYTGVYTRGSGDEDTTVFRIHDPWPPRRGSIYGTTYRSGIAQDRAVRPPKDVMIAYMAQV
jgi:hypothetical protein